MTGKRLPRPTLPLDADSRRRLERGAAFTVALYITVAILAMTLVMITCVTTTTQEHRTTSEHLRCLYAAEAGIDHALLELTRVGSGQVGSEEEPAVFDGGAYWVSSTDNGDGTFTLVSRGRWNGRTRVLEAVAREQGRIFQHALFAGNSSGSATYTLRLGGTGTSADAVRGDVYSGRHLAVTGNASIDGIARAGGQITGATGYTGVNQPIPDLAGMHYESHHDINVKALFDASATYQSDDAGGSAWQLPAANPAHFLRKNPSNRTTETLATAKDDWFLEDPYEPVRADPLMNGSDAYRITLASDVPGVRKVYYIDGNLWIHNTNTYSFKFISPGAAGIQVTFVVRGNLYVSDNIFYEDAARDGVAFIAIKDAAVPDSGNIYFGDPRFGTLEAMQAFMYAENNFHDTNLSASGSARVTVRGTMSAGNQVNIQRDFGTAHSKLTVDFDDRIKNGTIDMPGLPTVAQQLSYTIVSWRELSPRM